ncbi:hypothetical protein LUZ60_017314 [Juncus effusus]|nr:hypothetical protein LUZ60_017314 [Juncus effusus]
MEDPSSFWGPVTSTTELCEQNYTHSAYIAEFYNTISNIPSILLALIGLVTAVRQGFEKRFSMLHITNMILAIGSVMFHSTLQHIVQQSDETPMVWEILLYMYVLYSPDWHYRSTMPTFLFLYGLSFAFLHFFLHFQLAFKLHYILLSLLCIPRMYKYYIQTRDLSAKRLAKFYILTLFLGGVCWMGDRVFCKKMGGWVVNPQGHAWWHVLMGFNSYFANAFLMFCRAQQLGWEPKVERVLGFLPVVKVRKEKKEE